MKKRWLCYILILCLFLSVSACHIGGNQPAPSTPGGTELDTSDLSVSTELVEGSIKDDILRLDCISPGLDTFDLTVKLYDLTTEKVLCSVDLGEDTWQTGWLDDGFYAISLTKRTASLYDLNGKLCKKLAIPTEIQQLAVVALDENATTFLLGDAVQAKLCLAPVSGDTVVTVSPINGDVRYYGYQDGAFYLTNSDTGELLKIDLNDKSASVPICLPKATLLTTNCGVTSTESNFGIQTADRNKPCYVPFQHIDEIPVATSENGFFTIANEQDTVSLRLYHLTEQVLYRYRIPIGSFQVLPIDRDELLVLYKQDDAYRISRIGASEYADKEEITVLEENFLPSGTQPTSPPQSAPTTRGSKKISVPTMSQWPEYPTGCESVTAVMALRYAGESITVANFIDKHLPRSSHYYYQDGLRYGPDPYKVFIGSPRTTASYGCMAPVIETAINNYFGKKGRVVNTTGLSLEELCVTYIDKDVPVMVWATIAMIDSSPGASWYLEDGSRFSWPNNEHCLLLVGYDETRYYFNDPYTGSVVSYDKRLCNNRHEILGKQSLVIP